MTLNDIFFGLIKQRWPQSHARENALAGLREVAAIVGRW